MVNFSTSRFFKTFLPPLFAACKDSCQIKTQRICALTPPTLWYIFNQFIVINAKI